MRISLILLLWLCGGAAASAEPANNLAALFEKLRSCLGNIQLNSG